MFNRGQTAVALHLDGKRAIRAHLNGQVVWDGTRGAVVSIPIAMAMVTALVPGIHADSSAPAPVIAVTATAFAPAVTASSNVHPDTRIQVTATAFAPSATSTATIAAPLIMAEAVVLAPIVSEAFDRSIVVPRIDATATVFAPAIVGHYTAQVPLMVGSAEVLTPMITATGAAAVNVPMIAVNVTAFAPSVSSTVAIAAPLMTASAVVNAPELRRDGKITAPLITAEATAFVPNVQAINFQPQGMRKTANSTFQSSTPVLIAGMAADPAQPYSVVTSDRLIAQYSGPMRVAYCVGIQGNSDTGYIGAYVNDVLIGSNVTGPIPNFAVGATIFGSTDFTATKLDTVAAKIRLGNANFALTVVADRSRVNIYKQSQKQAVCTRSTNQTYTGAWSECIPSSSTADTVLDGNAIVAQFDHPALLLASDLTISAADTTRSRWYVNGVAVGTESSTAAYTGRLHNVASVPIVAGDKITLMISRASAGSSTLSSGTWGIV